MTNISRAKAVIDGLLDRTLTNANYVRIANAFVDDDTITNEEKAGIFLDKVTNILRQEVRRMEIQEDSAAQRVVHDTAVARADALFNT